MLLTNRFQAFGVVPCIRFAHQSIEVISDANFNFTVSEESEFIKKGNPATRQERAFKIIVLVTTEPKSVLSPFKNRGHKIIPGVFAKFPISVQDFLIQRINFRILFCEY